MTGEGGGLSRSVEKLRSVIEGDSLLNDDSRRVSVSSLSSSLLSSSLDLGSAIRMLMSLISKESSSSGRSTISGVSSTSVVSQHSDMYWLRGEGGGGQGSESELAPTKRRW